MNRIADCSSTVFRSLFLLFFGCCIRTFLLMSRPYPKHYENDTTYAWREQATESYSIPLIVCVCVCGFEEGDI